MSWVEYGLSRQEVTAILASHIAKREDLDISTHRGEVEFTVFRDRATGQLSVEFVKVRFEKKLEPPSPPMEPPAVPTFM